MERVIKKYVEEGKHSLLCCDYGKAYAFYLLVLKICPQMKNELKQDFSVAWKEWSIKLQQLCKTADLFVLYEQGCEVFMESDMLHFHMGNALFHLNMKMEAIGMFRKALVANKHCHEAWISLENACRGSVDSWHFAMLNDIQRNMNFELAISKVVKKNDTVLDIGTGTGILSMFAVKHNANKVFACEVSRVLQSIAKECIALNKMESSICLLPCYSTNLSVKQPTSPDNCINETITERCSLLISETVDAGLLGEGIIETLSHAWKNLLLPSNAGGKVIPCSATIHCALIECEEISKKHSLMEMCNFPGVVITSGVCVGSKGKENFSISSKSVATCNLEPYTSEALKKLNHKVLATSQKVIDIDFNDPALLETILSGAFGNISLKHCVTQPGYVDAIALWFDLVLENSSKSSTVINTSIGSRHCWDQAVYPVRVYETLVCKKFDNCLKTIPNFVFKRLHANEGDVIRTDFAVHSDCLVLHDLAKIFAAGENILKCPSLFSLSAFLDCESEFLHVAAREEQVLRMNDSSFSNTCFHAICNHLSTSNPERCAVLDMSNEFDLLAVKFARIAKVKMYKYCQAPAIQKALSKICRLCDVDVTFYSEIPSRLKITFDLIFLHVIEPSGLMSPNSISNLVQAASCLSPSGIVIPNRISMICQLIQSEELVSKCIVLSENTLGLNIADAMNDFRVSVHSDLDMDTVSYKELSTPQAIFNYNFNSSENSDLLNMETSLSIKTTHSGTVHGVLFWFKIYVCEDFVINTCKSSNHWKQACYVFPPCKQLALNYGEEIVLKATSTDDSQLFFISRLESNVH